MTAALTLARRGLGAVWPNPAVGCILVREQQVVGRGWTQPGGRPHAETEALRRAGEAAVGATAYVTLEPCPMCAQAISFGRIRRLYFAASDPKGGGVENGPRLFSQPTCHHRPDVYGGIDERRAGDLLQAFFAAKR